MSILLYKERESIAGLVVGADDEDAVVVVVVVLLLSGLISYYYSSYSSSSYCNRLVYDILFYCYGSCLSAKTSSAVLIP